MSAQGDPNSQFTELRDQADLFFQINGLFLKSPQLVEKLYSCYRDFSHTPHPASPWQHLGVAGLTPRTQQHCDITDRSPLLSLIVFNLMSLFCSKMASRMLQTLPSPRAWRSVSAGHWNSPGSVLMCHPGKSVGLSGRPRLLRPPGSPCPSLPGCCSCLPLAQARAPPGTCQASHITGCGEERGTHLQARSLGKWAVLSSLKLHPGALLVSQGAPHRLPAGHGLLGPSSLVFVWLPFSCSETVRRLQPFHL